MLRRTLGPSIEIVTAYRPDLPPIRVDPNQLELALLNLALNARDAMPQGGRLVIGGRCVASAADRPKELAAGRYVCMTVSDTGAGMDEATLKRAAEPFFTTKGAGKGTGLGLSMVHGVAAQSGGAMRMTSQLGEGTTVELWLPVSEAAAGGRSSLQPACVGDRRCRSYRVLVVDDDPLVVASTAAMLEDVGHVVTRGAVRRARARYAAARHQGRCRGHRSRDARHDRRRTGAADQADTGRICRSSWRPATPNCRTARIPDCRGCRSRICRRNWPRRSPRWSASPPQRDSRWRQHAARLRSALAKTSAHWPECRA